MAVLDPNADEPVEEPSPEERAEHEAEETAATWRVRRDEARRCAAILEVHSAAVPDPMARDEARRLWRLVCAEAAKWDDQLREYLASEGRR